MTHLDRNFTYCPMHIGWISSNLSDSQNGLIYLYHEHEKFWKLNISETPLWTPKKFEAGSTAIEPKFQEKLKRFLKIGFKWLKNRSEIGYFQAPIVRVAAFCCQSDYTHLKEHILKIKKSLKNLSHISDSRRYDGFSKVRKKPILASDGLRWPRRPDLRSSGPPKSRSLSKFWIMSRPRKMLPSMIFGHHK